MSGNGNGNGALRRLNRLARRAPGWMEEPGPHAASVLSSRVRLARNLASVPFPSENDDLSGVLKRIERATAAVPQLSASELWVFDDFEPEDLEFLIERRLVSRDLARGHRTRGVLVGPDEARSIMINEEDHYRLQSVATGLRLGEALDRIAELDRELEKHIEFAFDEKLGYLTACPTNVGTGMRASVLAHLPALVLTRRAKKVVRGVAAMGLAVRGFYGEGTEVQGNFFQISNQTTLGRDEHDIVSRLSEVVEQVLGYEEEARETMLRSARLQVEDKVYRAFATLTHARSLDPEEVVSLASAVRFGVGLELDDLCDVAALNEILVVSQPAHVRRIAGRELDRDEERHLRAALVRARLRGEPPSAIPGIEDDEAPPGSGT